MLGQVTNSLFSDDDIWVVLQDEGTLVCNLVDFLLQSISHIGFLGHLHVGLGFTLLVLKRAVQQQDSWVLDLSSHLRMGDVLVEHDSVQDLTLLEHSTGDFLDLGVPLDLEIELSGSLDALHDSSASLEGQVDNQSTPSGSKLGADTGVQSLLNVIIVHNIDRDCDLLENLERVLQSLSICSADDSWMYFVLNVRTGSLHHLSSETDD